MKSETDMSVFENRGVTAEQNEVNRRNTEILERLKERLEATQYQDEDVQKLIHHITV